MRLDPRRSVLLSAAAHGAAAVALVLCGSGGQGTSPPGRVQTRWEEAVVLEDPLPEPLPLDLPEVRVPSPAEDEALPIEEVPTEDPRFDAGPPPRAELPRDSALLGLGPGERRGRSRRGRTDGGEAASAAAADPPPAPLPEADVGPRPVPGACAAPDYPPRERRRGIEGVVGLRVLVGADGAVVRVDVDRSSGSPFLDAAAVEAVATWCFEPARRAGVAVEEAVGLRIRFTLERSGTAAGEETP